MAAHTPLPPRLLLCAWLVVLAGCDIPGLGPDPALARREAEAKAIGGGCRHGLRSVEDCYTLNPKASKSAIFEGWKDMDQYMRDNKIEGVRSTVTKADPEEEIIDEKPAKPASKTAAKAAAH